MQFTGRNLDLVRSALRVLAIDAQNQIATCPDPEEYADDIAEYEAELVAVRRLIARINKKLENTQCAAPTSANTPYDEGPFSVAHRIDTQTKEQA